VRTVEEDAMVGRGERIAALMLLALLAACGRKVDGVLYTTMDGGGKRVPASEVVVVPATKRSERALVQFCSEQRKRAAESEAGRVVLERRSVQLAADAERERARRGWSRKWRQLMDQSTAVSDSARSIPSEALASSSPLAQKLAVARATTNRKGEFHLTKVPYGKHLLVATADDDWGDIISVGWFRATHADLVTERAMPGCGLGEDFRR
jgi:hypothetical protein